MDLALRNLQTRVALNPPRILKTARTILLHEGVREASLSLVFVSRQRIKALNKKFLGRDYTTDVLAFDLSGRSASRKKRLAGEVIISTDAVLKNACAYETSPSRELALYIIHGICHLLGFDDHKTIDIREMRRKEQQLLAYLGKTAESLVK